nr:LysR family transcriptional regulator [uncultured Desulfobacter sp.]
MNQNWNDIQFFLALSRTNSFVSAAKQLKVTHSTVSRRISALEAALQTTLFVRTEKGCRLTLAGEQLLPIAEEVEKTTLKFQEQVVGKDNKLSGTIRIGTPDGLGTCFLASRLSTFQRENPLMEIELIAVPIYFSLYKREVDILITVKKPVQDKVIAQKITEYRFGLFASEKYLEQSGPIKKVSDLEGHRFVGYIDDLLYDPMLKFLEEYSPTLQTSFRSSTIIAQLNSIKAGLGIGVIPYFMAHTEPNLVPVLPKKYLERELWLQVNPDTKQLARVRATINFIVGQIRSQKDLFMSMPIINISRFDF